MCAELTRAAPGRDRRAGQEGDSGSPDLVREAADAFSRLRGTVADPALGRLATAIYLEDTFAITVTDADIELLDTLTGLRTVLDRHLGGR